jgi:hypothetical protein
MPHRGEHILQELAGRQVVVHVIGGCERNAGFPGQRLELRQPQRVMGTMMQFRGEGAAVSEEFARHPEADYGRVRDMSDDDGDDDRYRRGRDDDDDDDRDFRGASGDTGSVRLSVSPRDASVYVDGEFRGSGRDSSSLRLRPGRHRIEVVRPGYRTIEFDLERM